MDHKFGALTDWLCETLGSRLKCDQRPAMATRRCTVGSVKGGAAREVSGGGLNDSGGAQDGSPSDPHDRGLRWL
jgi:hypothetical protein